MPKAPDLLVDKMRILADKVADEAMTLPIEGKLESLKVLGELFAKMNRGRPADPPGSAFNEYRKQVASAGRNGGRVSSEGNVIPLGRGKAPGGSDDNLDGN